MTRMARSIRSKGASSEPLPLVVGAFHAPYFRPLVDTSEAAGTRTRDQRIKSPLLYRLSYSPQLGLKYDKPIAKRQPLGDSKTDGFEESLVARHPAKFSKHTLGLCAHR